MADMEYTITTTVGGTGNWHMDTSTQKYFYDDNSNLGWPAPKSIEPPTQEMIDDDIYGKALINDIHWAFTSSETQKPSKPKGDQPMETLYQVIVVSKDREVLLEKKIVAMDEDEAKFQVDIHSVLKEKGLKPKDVTILVWGCGEVKVRKEVQKVKVVEKDEE